VFEGCEKDVHVAVCVVGAVQNLTYQMESHNVILNWDAIEGVDQYEVYVNETLAATVETTAYAFDVEAGLTTIMVKAVADGCYVLGTSIEVCSVDPVTDLSFVAMDDSGLHFVWSDVPDVEYYEVTYNDITTQKTPEGGATNFSFDPIVGENTICVTVHSVYGCDSELACLSKAVCAAVDGFEYAFIGNEVTVTWDGDADSYQVSLDGSDVEIVEADVYSATLEGNHTIQVTPVYEDCLAFAAEFVFEVKNMAPEVRITNVREGLIAMAWDDVDGANAYNLYRDGELIAEHLNETTYNDTEMALNAQHCYAVQSVFEKGVSDVGEAACANYFNGLGENDGKLSIYPNPTSDKVNIECQGMSLIEVYNVEGKLVQRIQVEGDAYQIEGLDNGIYTLRIHKGEAVLVRRVVKM